MEFRVLGELQVEADGRPVPIHRARERALLAALLLHANETVSHELLIDELWGDDPPTTARHTLEGYVSRLRGALGAAAAAAAGPIETRPGGYRLQLDPEQLDAARFERLLGGGQTALATGAAAEAEQQLAAAEALWRGDVLSDVTLQQLGRAAADRLRELRLGAIEARIEAGLRLGRHAELVAELESRVDTHPLRERFRAQLMLALYRCGRQADALAAYQRGRDLLVGELGIEPGPELQQLQQAILRQEPELAAPVDATPSPQRASPPPLELTSFVGRERELRQLQDILERARFVTITGPGGTGKTRLAIHAAASLGERYSDGVAYVDAAPAGSSDELVAAIARAAGLQLDAYLLPVAARAQLLDFLRRRRLLLVIDNLEHLVASTDLLLELLDADRDVNLLVTSRVRLNMREEWILPLEGLDYTEDETGSEAPALRLFLDRQHQAEGHPPDSPADPAVRRICELVEGNPLAIELAAGWCPVLSAAELASEIERSLDVLATGSATTAERHGSLRAVFESSWRLLDTAQQNALLSLTVFSGGFRRDAASGVADVDAATLASLLAKSLLRRDPDGRFSIAETILHYARKKLGDNDAHALRHRHAGYYTQFVADRGRALLSDRAATASEEVLAELANLRTAVLFAVEDWDDDRGHEVLLSLRPFGLTQSPAEAAALFDRVVELLEQRGVTLDRRTRGWRPLATALAWKSYFDSFRGDPTSESTLDSAVPILARSELFQELAVALLALGIGAVFRGNHEAAVERLERSLQAAREDADELVEAACLLWLGWAHQQGGNQERAAAVYHDALAVAEQNGYALVRAYALSKLGMWSDERGDHTAAGEYHRRALAEFDALGNTAGHALALNRMSANALSLGTATEAERLAQQSLDEFTALGHRWGIPASHCRLGFAQLAQKHTRAARVSFTTALRLARESEMTEIEHDARTGLAAARSGGPERPHTLTAGQQPA